MPTQKDLKRLVRRRMQKTGESYTAARAQLLHTSTGRGPMLRVVPPVAITSPRVAEADYAKLAGMSDAALKAATGCPWKRWVNALDHAGAASWPHGRIAEYVRTQFEVGPWWTQAVVVGYERIRGLREKGQMRSGRYTVNKSRTVAAPVATLYRAFTVARTRARWLDGAKLEVRGATANKSVRMRWSDGTPLEARFTARGTGRSAVAIEHRELPSREAASGIKTFWSERLDALAALLTS
jgi:uncharacterized protein YndB with AHSA1/START domain